jgi:hypothetical protein
VDKRTRILGVIMIGYGTAVVGYIGYSIYRIQVEDMQNRLLDRKAERIVMRGIYAGEYTGKTRDEIVNDFEFWRIATRTEPSISER